MNNYPLEFQYGAWALEWAYIGEGLGGDYEKDDPNDVPLLRAYLLFDGEEVDNGSYCTLASLFTPKEKLEEFSKDLFRELPDSHEEFKKRSMQDWTWRTEYVEELDKV